MVWSPGFGWATQGHSGICSKAIPLSWLCVSGCCVAGKWCVLWRGPVCILLHLYDSAKSVFWCSKCLVFRPEHSISVSLDQRKHYLVNYRWALPYECLFSRAKWHLNGVPWLSLWQVLLFLWNIAWPLGSSSPFWLKSSLPGYWLWPNGQPVLVVPNFFNDGANWELWTFAPFPIYIYTSTQSYLWVLPSLKKQDDIIRIISLGLWKTVLQTWHQGLIEVGI